MRTVPLSQPTDAYIANLSVPQMVAILKSVVGLQDIDSVLLANRIMVQLSEAKGEEFVESILTPPAFR